MPELATQPIPEWKLRENHETQIRAHLKETKCMDSKGQLRSWKATTWEALKKLGHNSLNFDKCQCHHS
jgi:hypothetical protein